MRFFASAKINLTLHITGRRADGYHLLQSVMAPCDIGDVMHIDPASSYTLSVEGPFSSHAPLGEDNLVTRAMRLMERHAGRNADISIRLRKNVPAGAGLGGGSADAAAAMHALNAIWGSPYDIDALCAMGLEIGAELPFMLRGVAAMVEGIGEKQSPFDVPSMPAVVVWPGVALETGAVFKAYAASQRSFSEAALSGDWILRGRNDLLEAALTFTPLIDNTLEALTASHGCLLARMTGSGSSVFGIFEDMEAAMHGAAKISGANPSWWVRACVINPKN
ncbi:MAG: 4-(cytidine 5'-diphospho)-2-C-methyl-D-erythritol kinase [Proteobacteria bacterium]|nr:4-(cytidine 5'-diphospho)-2-C-methyl-D-erythritol kinase [Pseudomonadota bacterium]